MLYQSYFVKASMTVCRSSYPFPPARSLAVKPSAVTRSGSAPRSSKSLRNFYKTISNLSAVERLIIYEMTLMEETIKMKQLNFDRRTERFLSLARDTIKNQGH